MAITEMERVIKELGLIGIEISSNANGKSLDDLREAPPGNLV
ncbi:hypothetical protein [Neobacillus sp. MER 74]|nr:hypothetical protein [Neobacillus sp. MER 74]